MSVQQADWAPYRDLDDAVSAYCTYPELALDALGGVLQDGVVSFVIDRVVDLTPQGTTAWQEIAVLTAGRLLMWHSENEPDDEDGLVLRTSLRTVPLAALLDVGLRTHRRPVDDGTFEMLGTNLYLATGTPQVVAASDEDGERAIRAEIYRFSKRVDHDGAAQVNRLIEFGQAASRSLERR